jgi:hypothetical protein
MKNKNVSKWFTVNTCRSCRNQLSHFAVYYHNGTCPSCGTHSKSTITAHEKIVLRKVYAYPLWKFWMWWDYAYEGKSTRDHEWLIKNGFQVVSRR